MLILGDPEAMFQMALFYDSPPPSHQRDPFMSAKWYKLAAARGHVQACVSLGACYTTGDGVSRDSTKAAQWYGKAAKHGDSNAQFLLGSCYAEGRGVKQDWTLAFRWYQVRHKFYVARSLCFFSLDMRSFLFPHTLYFLNPTRSICSVSLFSYRLSRRTLTVCVRWRCATPTETECYRTEVSQGNCSRESRRCPMPIHRSVSLI